MPEWKTNEKGRKIRLHNKKRPISRIGRGAAIPKLPDMPKRHSNTPPAYHLPNGDPVFHPKRVPYPENARVAEASGNG